MIRNMSFGHVVHRSSLAQGRSMLILSLQLPLWIFLIQSVRFVISQSNPVLTPLKPMLGAQIAPDNESMFRLPNQSSVCASFVNSFYLDWTAAGSSSSYASSSSVLGGGGGGSGGAPGAGAGPNGARSTGSPWHSAPGWSEPRLSRVGQVVALPLSSSRTGRPGYPGSTAGAHGRQGYLENEPRGTGTTSTLYTFTTPMYPANYPPQIDCIKIIRAPSKTERIVLNFRGPIVFEPSANCDNDYLEIRDGQYGFSPLVGRFCTDSWRLRPIVSSGPWLWLRIQTDYTIEKSGFQAVYYFEENRPDIDSMPSTYFHKIESVITVDAGTVLTRSNLTQLMQAYAQTLERRPAVVSGVREFIFDIRAADEDMILRIHLETIKFPMEEAECYHNMIELYGRFFLSDRPKPRGARKTFSRSQTPPDTRVIRACNVASRGPILYRHGRAVVRLVATSSVVAMQAADQLEETAKHHHLTSRENTDLPELKLLATALTLAPCRPNWFPCLRVADLLNLDRQLNGTGDSVVNVLMQPEEQQPFGDRRSRTTARQSKPSTVDARERWTRRRELVGDSVYCVAISRLCNQFNDCPNGEDEDECPRPRDNLKDLLQFYAEQDSTQVGDTASTTTPIPVKSKKEREEEEDEFHHHPSIIVGLLGFCAICGLLSAGMTLVNRGKETKRRNFSSICNRVLFDSGTSLLTTLEEGSVLQLKGRDSKLAKHGLEDTQQAVNHATNADVKEDESGSIREGICSSTPSDGPTVRAEVLTKQNPRRCLERMCTVLKKRPKSDPLPPSALADSTPLDHVYPVDQQTKESCSSADIVEPSDSVELSSRNQMEVFDRATVPMDYTGRGWDEASVDFTRARNPLRRKVQSGDLRTHLSQSMTRANAASFGHLPNTIVCPVEKLSDVIYHCGMSSPESSLNRTVWNRSGPLPLVTESSSALASNYWHDAFHNTRSAKCLSRRASAERQNGSAFDVVRSSSSSRTAVCNPDRRTPSVGARPGMTHMFTGQLINTADGYTYTQPSLDAVASYADQFDAMSREQKSGGPGRGKRKTFKGSAPKRARYSIDPSNEPNQMNNSVEASFAASDYGEAGQRPVSSGNTAQTSLFWTSSCSTSGELLNSGPPSRPEVLRSWRDISTGTQLCSKPVHWSGLFAGTRGDEHATGSGTFRGHSGTPSEDVSLADLNASDNVTSKLIYHCESASLGPIAAAVAARTDRAAVIDSHEGAEEQDDDEDDDGNNKGRVLTIGRVSKPDASFKVTVMPRVRGSVNTTTAPSNEPAYRAATRPHRSAQSQLSGYFASSNTFSRLMADQRASAVLADQTDDSEDTATQNQSEESESGTYSDDRLLNNNISSQRRENHVWQASDEQTVSSESSPVSNSKLNQRSMIGKSKRTPNSTTIIITSRDGTRQIYREEQL